MNPDSILRGWCKIMDSGWDKEGRVLEQIFRSFNTFRAFRQSFQTPSLLYLLHLSITSSNSTHITLH